MRMHKNESPADVTRWLLAIQRMTTRQRQTQQRGKYRELIGIAEEVVEQARSGLRHTRKVRAKDVPSQLALEELRREIEHYLWSRSTPGRSSPSSGAPGRAGCQCREDLFDLRAAYRSDHARQGANTSRIRSQSLPRRKRAGSDHPI